MNNQIATDIYNQLGGGRFVTMTGAKNFVWDEEKNTLRMTLPRNGSKANRLEITYNYAEDDYNMNFYYYKAGGWKVDHKKQEVKIMPEVYKDIKKFNHVYCDQLQELFTSVTKMYTHL